MAALALILAVLSLGALGEQRGASASPHGAAPSFAVATAYVGSAGDDPPSCKVVLGVIDRDNPLAFAVGSFNDTIDSTGWSVLTVETTQPRGVNDAAAAVAVGCLEGFLTQHRIWQFYLNAKANLFPNGSLPLALDLFLGLQQGWVGYQVDLNAPSDPYWQAMGLLMTQFDGLVQGYSQAADPLNQPITSMEMYALTSNGDLQTLQLFQQEADAPQNLDCSALIKLTPSGDLLFGHATWSYYWGAMRIYKHYRLSYTNAGTLSFSSYPATLTSVDDFYIAHDSRLAIMETTNGLYNRTLLESVTPFASLSWQRATLASMMARSATEWVDLFPRYNSGTYNNQWMCMQLDPANFSLLVLESMPGMYHWDDLTPVLQEQGYWASYNVPYFPDIYNASGFAAMEAKYGDEYSWSRCARARIFARNQTELSGDLASFQALLRYNNYLHDPLSGSDPMHAVASRGDLSPQQPQLFGAIDSKVGLASEVLATGVVHAVSGPTNTQVPTFRFSGVADPTLRNLSHIGLPDAWEFGWVPMQYVPL